MVLDLKIAISERSSLMKLKKDDIYKSVLTIAREEFFEKGYKDTSMRAIAQKAGVGLSNIYNYFTSKDDIFQEVLTPAIAALEKTMEEHHSEANISIDIFESQTYLKEQTQLFVEPILKFKDELRLLLFKSHGSSLEDFKERYIDSRTKAGLEHLTLMKEKYPHINIDISDFFVHTMSSWWINILGELVMHELETKELERFISEYIEFSAAGWKKLMNV
jgi:AcrR family transcriptional regulator